MTPAEYAAELELKIAELQGLNRPFRLAVYSTVGKMSRRIFVDGQNDQGQTFQYNSTDPIYVSDARQKKVLTGKGKDGSDTFKSGKKKGQKHKSTYFDSYKAFREQLGLKSDKVVWILNDDLKSDYLNAKDVQNASPIEVSANEYRQVIRSENIEKYAGLSKRYGSFLNLSSSEIKYFYDINEKELALFLSK